MFLVNGDICYGYKLIHPRTGFWTASFQSKKSYSVGSLVSITNEFTGLYIGEVISKVELFDINKYIVSPRVKGTTTSIQYLFTPVSAIALALIGSKSQVVSSKIITYTSFNGSSLENLYYLCNTIGDGLHVNSGGFIQLESQLKLPIVPNKYLDKMNGWVTIPLQKILTFPSNIDRLEVTEKNMVLYGSNI